MMRNTKRLGTSLGRMLAATAVALVALGAQPVTQDPLARALSEQLERAARNPNDARVANDLGNLLALSGRSDEAEAAYRHSIELAPEQPTAHYNLGQLLVDRGENFAARRELKRTIALDPAHAGAHYYLGVVYARWGWKSAARKSYVRAFALDPALADPRHNPDVVENRQALAAQLLTWSNDVTQGPSRVYLQADRIARQANLAAPAPTDSAPTPDGAGSEGGGGFARSYDAPPQPPQPLRTERPAEDSQVLDSSSLRQSRSVNQAQPSTASPSGRHRGRPAPAPTPQVFVQPFAVRPDSTGRIEQELAPSDPSSFAVGG